MKRKLTIAVVGILGGLFHLRDQQVRMVTIQDFAAAAVQAVMDNRRFFIAGAMPLMQAGFAMLESGLTRSKNVGNIMAKNLADAAIGIMAFFWSATALHTAVIQAAVTALAGGRSPLVERSSI